MKNLICLFALLIATNFLIAQDLQESVKPMSKGENVAISFELPQTSTKEAKKTWKKFMKSYKGKTKYNKKTKEYFTDNTTIKEMSNNTIDVYAAFTDAGEGTTTIDIWYDLGGAYITSETHPEAYMAAENMIGKYTLIFQKRIAKALIEQEEKALSTLEKEYKNLEKEEENLLKKIAEAKKLIANSEKNISEKKQQQADQMEKVNMQKIKVDEAKNKLKAIEN